MKKFVVFVLSFFIIVYVCPFRQQELVSPEGKHDAQPSWPVLQQRTVRDCQGGLLDH